MVLRLPDWAQTEAAGRGGRGGNGRRFSFFLCQGCHHVLAHHLAAYVGSVLEEPRGNLGSRSLQGAENQHEPKWDVDMQNEFIKNLRFILSPTCLPLVVSEEVFHLSDHFLSVGLEFIEKVGIMLVKRVLPSTWEWCATNILFVAFSRDSGAQIIDLMMLVIDVTKGMQTQSAECLVIGQIACQKMIVVLNKTDLLPEEKRQAVIEKMAKKMQKTLENTKFCGCPIVPVAAKPGGPEAPETVTPIGVSELIEVLKSEAYLPKRDPSGSFLMAIDHCFSIKGQGTVMTGTILSGCVSIGDNVEIPALKPTNFSWLASWESKKSLWKTLYGTVQPLTWYY
uniref:Uncharacterized protein n=1 Tax=Sphaerodactylus townsendi TaxID=933632 RepID=A0ACB8EHP1_9SAUR